MEEVNLESALDAGDHGPPRVTGGESTSPMGGADAELDADVDGEPFDLPDDVVDDDNEGEDDPFTLVPAPLRTALIGRGFKSLTPVQHAVLAAGATGDLRISSETGSGKTVALGFVVASAVLAGRVQGGPRVLVIVPTRELAAQLERELEWLYAEIKGASVVSVTGGTSTYQERQRLAKKPAVVVGTPGRLLDHLTRGALDAGSVVELVLDEADQMLDMGFREDLEAILERMPAERRTHLVSATFAPEIKRLAQTYQRDPREVQGTRLGDANLNIEHIVHLVGRDDRYDVLVNLLLLADGERTLVFVNTRADVAKVAQQLAADGFAALPLSGEMAQNERTRTLAAFRSGQVSTLVATDVAARGLDVPDVGMVVHATPSIDAESYVHRSGRTGRAGSSGRSVVLAPANRQRPIRRLFEWARIEAAWVPAPSASEVEAVLGQRRHRAILAAVDSGDSVSAAAREFARRLIEERDAAEVVAVLLERGPSRAPTHARQVRSTKPQGVFPGSRGEAPRGNEGRSLPPRLEGVAQGELGFLRFSINWGLADGANPKRILAHVCRRGGVTSRAIGAIVLGNTSSTIDVLTEAASGFAQRVAKRDPREPHLVVEPLSAGRVAEPRMDGPGGRREERPRWRTHR